MGGQAAVGLVFPPALALPATFLIPWLAASAIAIPGWKRRLPAWAPWLAAPAFVVAVGLSPGATGGLSWVLLDLRLSLDETGLVFLRFSALIWLLAGIYARGYLREDRAAPRFFAFWLVAVGANAGLLLSGDMVTFYLFFAALGLACYGLIFHDRTPQAVRAAQVYLTYVLIGDALLFAALVLIARETGGVLSIPADVSIGPAPIALVLAGLGVKLGVVPLHSWLPIAHPAAPVPASAVLSGVIIKSGLFGWLRFLPLGVVALPGWSGALIAGGVFAVFYAAVVGSLQRDPKTVLAYSSVSQMGLISVAVGLGLSGPAAWPSARFAVLLYATHHAVTKSVLFLGVGGVAGARGRHARIAALSVVGVAAGALAGFPWTSGAAAKAALHAAEVGAETAGLHMSWLPLALSLGAAATAVLMGRYLWTLVGAPHAGADRRAAGPRPSGTAAGHPLPAGAWVVWGLLFAALLTVPAWPMPGGSGLRLLGEADPWAALWPVALGAGIVLLAWTTAWRAGAGAPDLDAPGPPEPAVPPGDILVPAARGMVVVARAAAALAVGVGLLFHAGADAFRRDHAGRHGAGIRAAWVRADRFVRRWPGVGALIALFLLSMIVLWRLAAG